LLSAALVVGLVLSSLFLIRRLENHHLPGNQQGYEPEQPIAFSHKLHAGDMQISCVYCHHGAETSRQAGIPAASICMSCHRFVTAPQSVVLPEIIEARKAKRAPMRIISPEMQKLYDALGLDKNLEPDPNKKPEPIQWIKVHNLPAYACFDHRSHVRAGVDCQKCHGAVDTMDRIRQESDLSMGWCVNCHRDAAKNGVAGKPVHTSLDCATCHN
jgi:hypothetical protein